MYPILEPIHRGLILHALVFTALELILNATDVPIFKHGYDTNLAAFG